MRAVIACALVFASCAKGGVEIVVTGAGDQVNKVHLFVGVGDGYTESINTAKRAFPFPKSDAFARDDYNELDVRDVKAGQSVTFQFQGHDKLGVVIAVGVNGDTPLSAGVLRTIDIPSDYVARYEIKLEPINDGTNLSPLELDVWEPQVGSPKEGNVCVALFDKRTTSADAVVTDGDPDCDGWPTGDPKECQPNLYMSFKRPALDDAACLLSEMTPDSSVAGCVLGGPACADGHGKEVGCNAPSPYCTLQSVCNACRPRGTDAWNCARAFTNFTTSGVTHIHCKLYFDTNGNLCTSPIKAFAQPPMNVSGHFCRTGIESPPRITTAGQPWGSTIMFTEGGRNFTVKIDNLQPSCNFDITASGGGGQGLYSGLVAGMLDNGRGIAVPIAFELNPLNVGCDTQPACASTWSWNLPELVDTCVNTPVFPP